MKGSITGKEESVVFKKAGGTRNVGKNIGISLGSGTMKASPLVIPRKGTKRIELRATFDVEGVKGKIIREFDTNTLVGDIIKQFMKKVPRVCSLSRES